jgi:Cu/Ag efflux protein CusF
MKSVLRAFAVAAAVSSIALPYSVQAADDLSEATVKKVEKAEGRVTLAHGPIANIGMPPMTMMFKVKDAAMLKKVKEGDKVRFRVEETGGAYVVVRMEPAK